MKRALATVAIGVALIGSAQAQRSSRYDVVDESAMTRTLSLPPVAAGPWTCGISTASSTSKATDDSAVQMSIRKVIRAETQR